MKKFIKFNIGGSTSLHYLIDQMIREMISGTTIVAIREKTSSECKLLVNRSKADYKAV